METGGGRCPKLKGPNVPYMLQNIGIQPNPQKCQTANSNKCQITLFALGVCKICPGCTFFSPIPSPTAAPIYFVHFRKVQVLNLGRKSNQSAIWSKISDSKWALICFTPKDFICSLTSILLINICTELIFHYKCENMLLYVQSNEKGEALDWKYEFCWQVSMEGVSIT